MTVILTLTLPDDKAEQSRSLSVIERTAINWEGDATVTRYDIEIEDE